MPHVKQTRSLLTVGVASQNGSRLSAREVCSTNRDIMFPKRPYSDLIALGVFFVCSWTFSTGHFTISQHYVYRGSGPKEAFGQMELLFRCAQRRLTRVIQGQFKFVNGTCLDADAEDPERFEPYNLVVGCDRRKTLTNSVLNFGPSLTMMVSCEREWLKVMGFGIRGSPSINKCMDTEHMAKPWRDYQMGFRYYGTTAAKWIGLTTLHKLTAWREYMLRVDIHVSSSGGSGGYTEYMAFYDRFRVGNATSNYTLSLGQYVQHSSKAGDELGRVGVDGAQFSTYDIDNDESDLNCAREMKQGFWYRSCDDIREFKNASKECILSDRACKYPCRGGYEYIQYRYSCPAAFCLRWCPEKWNEVIQGVRMYIRPLN